MSATLTWAGSGLGTKTGTGNANVLDDLDTLITSKAGDATFFWQKAGKSSATTPRWLLLSPKDGSNRRIAIIIFDSAPAANNAAILDTTPTSNVVQIVYFPNGSANTLSNLTSASGTVCGNDTGVVKCTASSTVASLYAASIQPFYFDSAEAVHFFFQNPASATVIGLGAGSIVVDGSDVAYDACIASAAFGTFAVASTFLTWSSAAILAGSSTSCLRTNYGASNRIYFCGLSPTGTWANQAVGPLDILTDTSLNKAWFAPMQLLGQTKGEGFVLKLRQIGFGPGTVGPLTVYNTTGPVVAARQVNAATIGGTGCAWVTNFKI